MSEIEKMYKNAGIMRRRKCEFYEECPIGFSHSCDNCDIEYRESNSSYPPFTAGKQIELIKWLAKKDCMYRLTYERDFLWCSQLEWQSSFCYESFEESLANLVNAIWQDLTEKDKQQIKDILE